MSRFDHQVFIYLSLETTHKRRFTLSQHLELPPLKEIVERIKVTCQLIEIGLKSFAWAIGGKPWPKTMAGNYGGAL
jgi:hypothetical protein